MGENGRKKGKVEGLEMRERGTNRGVKMGERESAKRGKSGRVVKIGDKRIKGENAGWKN